jgi:cytoskeletal protein CcmA (bactofilin family)
MSKENFKEVETIIGPSVKVEGDFKADGNVVIEGQVVGSFKTKSGLRVGENAKIKAEIEADNAWVAGEIKGNINIKDHLEISGNAKITGDISTNLLTIETGAVINGKLNMGEGGQVEHTEVETEE